jgi:hypothetical protein
MMFGVGFIMMILVFGLPVVLVVALIWGLTKRPSNASLLSLQTPARACLHCGTGLQTGWSHCAQCGAPVNPA